MVEHNEAQGTVVTAPNYRAEVVNARHLGGRGGMVAENCRDRKKRKKNDRRKERDDFLSLFIFVHGCLILGGVVDVV